MATPEPLKIDIGQWRTLDRTAIIQKFVASAIKMPNQFHPDNPTRQLIHWRGAGAYPLVADNGDVLGYRSTSFDTRKRPDKGNAVEVQFISKAFDVSSHSVYSWVRDFVREYTARDVYNLVIVNRLNEFQYNGSGSGCRTWTTRLIQVLEEEGVLPAGSTLSFLEKVAEARANPAFWVPDELGAEFAVDG